jgi:hypothetical protein
MNGIKKSDILIGMKVQGLGILNLRGVAEEVLWEKMFLKIFVIMPNNP